jgi:hypothetical protein
LEGLTAVVMKISIFLEYNAMQYVQSKPTFRRNISSPSSSSKNNPSKKPDTPVGFQWTARFHIPEERTPGHREIVCEDIVWGNDTQDTNHWHAFIKSVMNLRVPIKSGEFFD